MRISQYFFSTLKEIPADAEIISHKLMLRSGMIQKLSSGLYTWLPIGFRVLKKIEKIIRKEMTKIGAIEICMPIIQPAELWKESCRLDKYGQELLKFFNRNKRLFILGPTHEEVITDLMRNKLNSYKQLPLNLFQIQTKFRDEIRPRFGVMRSREFLMKDAYSFHISSESLQKTYEDMYKTYETIFTNIGLNFHVVEADTGSMEGSISHEFHILSQSGEDNIIVSDTSNFAANIEFVEAINPSYFRQKATEKMQLVDTSHIKDIHELIEKFNLSIKKVVKTFLIKAEKGSTFPFIAVLLRADHDLNKTKVEKLPQVFRPLTFATESEVLSFIKDTNLNFLGPINMPVPLIIDRTVSTMSDFIAGANIYGKHFFGINWDRDIDTPTIADIRNVVQGDLSPDGSGRLIIKRSIEIGHIFQLNTRYSKSMCAFVQGENGCNYPIFMGCYGIGITRLVSALIEQNHDQHGIIWPDNVAPFQVIILPINMYKSFCVKKESEKIYNELINHNIDVLIDDRKEHPGIMFVDADLIGIPHIIIVSDRNLINNNIEYKYRPNNIRRIFKTNEIINFLIKTIKPL